MRQGDPSGGLGQRRKVIRQPHDAERLDECWGCGQIAEPSGGECEGLGHGPADRESRVVRKELEGGRSANPRELVVGLIDDDHTRCDVTDGTNGFQADGGAGGVVRAGDEHDVRPRFPYRCRGRVRIDGEVVAAGNRAPFAVRVPGVLGYIEYVGANESTRRPGPANASSTWSITSLLPLAAQICSALNPLPR